MRDLIFIAIAMSCSLVAVRRPLFGCLAFVVFGFLNPQTWTWGVGRTFPGSKLVASATVVGCLFRGNAFKFPRQRETFLLLTLWVIFAISTNFSFYPDIAFERFVDVSKILLMVILTICLINTRDQLDWLFRAISLSLGFYALKSSLFVLVTGGNYLIYGPEQTFLENNTTMGLAFAMNMPLLVYLLTRETSTLFRWLIKAMLLVSPPVIVFTYSRGAWIGLAIVLALLALRSKHTVQVLLFAGVLSVVSLPFVAQLLPQRLANRYDALVNYDEEKSAQARLLSWELCKRVGMAHPLTGGGFDFYSEVVYETYTPDLVESFSEQFGKWLPWSCHSVWYVILGEHGLLGFVVWIAFMISCVFRLRQIRLYGRNYPELAWVIKCSDMLQISLVAFLVVGTFLNAAYFDMYYYLTGAIIIISKLVHRTVADTPMTRLQVRDMVSFRP